MYKHFQGANAQQICENLNKNKMQIHSVEKTNGLIQCIAVPSDESQKINHLSGSVLAVTKMLNDYGRKIEGKVLIVGHSATAFYRVDEDQEAKMKAKMDEAANKARSEAEKAEKEAKKAEVAKQLKELQDKMKSIDSEPTDSEKEAADEKAKADAAEDARMAEVEKEEAKAKILKEDASRKKSEAEAMKKAEAKKANKDK